MKSRVVSLFLGVAFIAAPVSAQIRPASNSGPGGGGAIQQLASEVAALTARVAKLEGNIVAADLAGAYSFTVFGTSMSGLHAGPPVVDATISTSVLRGTLTLNANGTGTAEPQTGNALLPPCEGSTLAVPSGAMHAADCDNAPTDVTWTYVDGVITIKFLNGGNELPFNVAVGGRFLILTFAPFHPRDPSSDQVLFLATRLK